METLVRVHGEAVEVQAVIPIGSTDQRQTVRTHVVHYVIETDSQVLHQTHLCTRFVIPWYHLVQDTIITCLADVRCCTEDQPHRVVIETAADIVVTAFGERLVLMVTASVGELRRSDINDTLTSTGRDLMHEAYEVLVRIAETHATTYSALEERCRTAHAERDHTLVLVPNIDHAVQTLITALYMIFAKQLIPQGVQFSKCLIYSLYRCKTFEHLVRVFLINNMMILLA